MKNYGQNMSLQGDTSGNNGVDQDVNMSDDTPRQRKMTEKGLGYLIARQQQNRTSALKNANSLGNELRLWLNSASASNASDVKEVNACLARLEQEMTGFVQCHKEYCSTAEIDQDERAWFQSRYEALDALRCEALEWIERATPGIHPPPQDSLPGSLGPPLLDLLGQDEVTPHDSVSQVDCSERGSRVSRHSSRSSRHSRSSAASTSVSSARLREAMKKASLVAEAANLAQKQALQRKELEIEQAKESLNLDTEIAIAEAKEQILVELETEQSTHSVAKSIRKGGSSRNEGISANEQVDLQMEDFRTYTCRSEREGIKDSKPVNNVIIDRPMAQVDQTQKCQSGLDPHCPPFVPEIPVRDKYSVRR